MNPQDDLDPPENFFAGCFWAVLFSAAIVTGGWMLASTLWHLIGDGR